MNNHQEFTKEELEDIRHALHYMKHTLMDYEKISMDSPQIFSHPYAEEIERISKLYEKNYTYLEQAELFSE